MEIERKFLIKTLPKNLDSYPFHEIEQGYLCTSPVLRIRRKDDKFIFTYKGQGLMAREEIEATLTEEAYLHLREKADGHLIQKRRYLIPYGNYTIELDIFGGHMKPLIMAEVEFPSEEEANSFVAPDWFGEDVTMDRRYHNANMINSDFN